MPKSKGKLIVFEGIDGSGKATQTKLLCKYIQQKKLKYAQIAFPQYKKSFFGKLVGRYLKGEFGGVNEVSAYLAAVLYAGDRFEAKDFILKNLNENKIVIADRYAASNIAHQGAKLLPKERDDFFRWLSRLEYEIYKIPKEDATVFLNIDNKKAFLLRRKRELLKNTEADIHEKATGYLLEVEKLYKRLASQGKNWIKIDCLNKSKKIKTPLQIHKEIIKALKKRKILI